MAGCPPIHQSRTSEVSGGAFAGKVILINPLDLLAKPPLKTSEVWSRSLRLALMDALSAQAHGGCCLRIAPYLYLYGEEKHCEGNG